jgi:hypothetical protein
VCVYVDVDSHPLRLPEALHAPPSSLDTQIALFSETVTFDRQALTTFLAQHVSTSTNYVRRWYLSHGAASGVALGTFSLATTRLLFSGAQTSTPTSMPHPSSHPHLLSPHGALVGALWPTMQPSEALAGSADLPSTDVGLRESATALPLAWRVKGFVRLTDSHAVLQQVGAGCCAGCAGCAGCCNRWVVGVVRVCWASRGSGASLLGFGGRLRVLVAFQWNLIVGVVAHTHFSCPGLESHLAVLHVHVRQVDAVPGAVHFAPLEPHHINALGACVGRPCPLTPPPHLNACCTLTPARSPTARWQCNRLHGYPSTIPAVVCGPTSNGGSCLRASGLAARVPARAAAPKGHANGTRGCFGGGKGGCWRHVGVGIRGCRAGAGGEDGAPATLSGRMSVTRPRVSNLVCCVLVCGCVLLAAGIHHNQGAGRHSTPATV